MKHMLLACCVVVMSLAFVPLTTSVAFEEWEGILPSNMGTGSSEFGTDIGNSRTVTDSRDWEGILPSVTDTDTGNSDGDSGSTDTDTDNSGADSGNTDVDTGDSGADSGNTDTDTSNSDGDSGSTDTDTDNSGADSGKTDADTGDSGADSGNIDTDTGNSGGDSGSTDTDTDNSGADSGKTDADTGDSGADSGKTDADTGDSGADSGNTDTDTGDSGADSENTDTDTGDSGADTVNSKFPIYSFKNSVEYLQNIPLSLYQSVYGETYFAEQQYALQEKLSEKWIDRNYGMLATLELLYQSDNDITPSHFRSDAVKADELSLTDKNADLNLTLAEFIETMQITQQSFAFCQTYAKNLNRLPELCSAVAEFQDSQCNPVIICIDETNGAHALLGYRLEENNLYTLVHVYDPNFSDERSRFIYLGKDKNGQYIRWSYTADAEHKWGSESDSMITFIPYQTVRATWVSRGEVENTMALMRVNVPDCTIYDTEGPMIASFRNGVMTYGAEDVYPMPLRAFSSNGNDTETPDILVWLPSNDMYLVANDSASIKTYQVSFINIQQGISVTTDADYVELAVEDSSVSSSVFISETKCNYTIDMISNLDTKFHEVHFSGVTASDRVLAILRHSGHMSLQGITEDTKLSVNKEDVSPGLYYRKDMDSHTVSLAFTDVSRGKYYYNAVKWSVFRKITVGTTPTTFSPDKNCTRNHILTFLWRANGSPESEIANPFSDVGATTNSDFAKAATWAYEKNLVAGSLFQGNTPCKRAEVVLYLWKLSGSPSVETIAPFTDIPKDADYAQAVAWAVKKESPREHQKLNLTQTASANVGRL